MSETVANEVQMPLKAAGLNLQNPFEATSKSILKNTGTVDFTKQMSQSFDRSMHQPFRLDNKGFNNDVGQKDWAKGNQNIGFGASEEVKIPTWWQKGEKANPNRTFTDMQRNRRKEFVPDISFDLDGDGQVGNRDLVLSKLFDKDGDGKLNAQERKNAEDAIRNVSNL